MIGLGSNPNNTRLNASGIAYRSLPACEPIIGLENIAVTRDLKRTPVRLGRGNVIENQHLEAVVLD